MFRELSLPKMVALELRILAKWCLHWSKAKDALPFAKEALDFFKKPSLQQRLGGCFDGASRAGICGD